MKVPEWQQVISSGPYRLVRHPMYAGTLLFFVGAPLLLGSWIGLAFVPIFAVVSRRAAVLEERVLAAGVKGYVW